MKKTDKDLLLKDICARLPYGVKIHINSCIEEQNQMQLFDVNLDAETIGVGNKKWAFRAIPIIDDDDETKVIKPYLRPMSSMTEEEKRTFVSLSNNMIDDWMVKPETCCYFMDKLNIWLNVHHLDHRGLIPMGLALEAPEDMYNGE